jgi:hypothetical protein
LKGKIIMSKITVYYEKGILHGNSLDWNETLEVPKSMAGFICDAIDIGGVFIPHKRLNENEVEMDFIPLHRIIRFSGIVEAKEKKS